MTVFDVLTLNVWGLKVLSKRRKERIRYLGDFLRQTRVDVVLLQEVWVAADAEHLLACGRQGGLRHGIHFKSGLFGSGLVTLSRFPVVDTGFWRYAAGGDAADVTLGDYYAGKGYGWVRLSTPHGCIDVVNTHLHANYIHTTRPLLLPPAAAAAAPPSPSTSQPWGQYPTDKHGPVRASHVVELATLAEHVAKAGSIGLILGGDLNIKPDSLEMRLLQVLLPQLADSYLACRAGSKAAIPDGFTCHAPGNSFHYSRQIPERIDYVLSSFECTRCEITLQMTPGGFSYSDHFAIHARLDLDGLATTTATEALPQAEVLKTSLQLLREGSAAAAAHARWRQRAAAAVAALGIACLLFAACGHSLAVALPAPHGPAAAKLLAAVDHRALYGAFGLLAKLLAVVAFVIWQIGFQANSTLSNTLLQATRRLEVLCRVTAGGGCAGGAAAAATNGNGTRHS